MNSYNKSMHRYTVTTAIFTFFLIVAGGLVTSTGSGLAVPDWPLSYGQIMPPMVGGIFYEHGHRLIASFVGLLTVVLAVWYWKKEKRMWVRNLALTALAAVILQGILGGMTVLFLLPTAISVSHATLAQTFFCVVVSLSLFTSKWWINNDSGSLKQDGGLGSLLNVSVFLTVAVYIQLILGALMRHTASGLAIPDFPLAYGQFFPSLSAESLAEYNRQLLRDDYRIAADGPIAGGQILIHMLHRLWAVAVTVLGVWTSIKAFRSGGVRSRFRAFSYLIQLLLLMQLTLGALTVLTRKSIDITTAHVANGALLLAVSLILTLHVVRLQGLDWKTTFSLFLSRREAIA